MKRFVSMLIIIGIAFSSQCSIAQTGSALSTQPTSTKQRVVKHVPKVKLFRSNPYRYHAIYVDEQDDIEVDDEGLMSPYRREDLFKLVEQDDISDNVRWRLFLIRQLALLKQQARYTIAG